MNGSSDALDQPISVPRSPCYGLALLRRRRSQPLASVFARFVILLGCVGTFAALLAGCAPKFAPIPGAASQFDRDHFECEAIAHGMTEGSRQAMMQSMAFGNNSAGWAGFGIRPQAQGHPAPHW